MLTSEGNVLTTRRKKETFWGLFFPMGVEKKNEKKEKNTLSCLAINFFFFLLIQNVVISLSMFVRHALSCMLHVSLLFSDLLYK